MRSAAGFLFDGATVVGRPSVVAPTVPEIDVQQPTGNSLEDGHTKVSFGTINTVTFKPTAKGLRSAKIHIKSNDAYEASFDVVLTGRGQQPRVGG